MDAKELHENLKENNRAIVIDGEEFTIVEGDLLMTDKELYSYASAYVAEHSVQSNEQRGLVAMVDRDGNFVSQPPGEALTYWVQKNSFRSDAEYAVAVRNMRRATKAWSIVCNVKFKHIEKFDDQGPGEEKTSFVVRFIDDPYGPIASAFFPVSPEYRRRVLLYPDYYSPNLGFDKVGVLRHELGHVLGWRHEHIRDHAPPTCPNEESAYLGTYAVAITKYDPKSVMHYFCGGNGSLEMEITELDEAGAVEVYGPPEL